MIDAELEELRQLITDLFNPPGTSEVDTVLRHVRSHMTNYALAAVMDSAIRQEALAICQEQEDAGLPGTSGEDAL